MIYNLAIRGVKRNNHKEISYILTYLFLGAPKSNRVALSNSTIFFLPIFTLSALHSLPYPLRDVH